MFRTTLTVLFAALTLSVPAFAQKGATGQDATQTKPLAELKETESTYEEVPMVVGTGSTKPLAEEPAVVVLERRAVAPIKVTAEPIEYPQVEEPAMHEPLEEPAMGTTDRLAGGVHLDLWWEAGILNADLFHVGGKWFGAVLIGLSPELVPMDMLGTALLRDSVVLGMGFAPEGYLGLRVPTAKDLKGIKFFGQGVVADEFSIRSSAAVLGLMQ